MNFNGLLLIIPLILVRYPVLAFLNSDALQRANYFPPLEGREKLAFYVYQVSNTVLIFSLFWLRVKQGKTFFYPGLLIYLLGFILYTISIVDYARPQVQGINTGGLYRYSRNPMYVACFLFFLGCGLLSSSWLYILIVLIFQLSVHWLILSEERWCLLEFGDDYREYMTRVRRYI